VATSKKAATAGPGPPLIDANAYCVKLLYQWDEVRGRSFGRPAGCPRRSRLQSCKRRPDIASRFRNDRLLVFLAQQPLHRGGDLADRERLADVRVETGLLRPMHVVRADEAGQRHAGRSRSASGSEKVPQQRGGFVCEQATLHFDAMIVAIGRQGVEHAAGGAGLGILGGVNDACDACMHQGHRAHRAGFQGYV